MNIKVRHSETLKSLERYHEAEIIDLEIIAEREKRFGPKHVETLTSKENYVVTL